LKWVAHYTGDKELEAEYQRQEKHAEAMPVEAVVQFGFEVLGLYGSVKASQGFWATTKVLKGKAITGLQKHGITVPTLRKYSPINIYEKIKIIVLLLLHTRRAIK